MILKRCEKLMQGLAFAQQSELMSQLSPLVEKMHYSIAASVNQQLGGNLRYVLTGKTATTVDKTTGQSVLNQEFGGMFTLKPSGPRRHLPGGQGRRGQGAAHQAGAGGLWRRLSPADGILPGIQPLHAGKDGIRRRPRGV